MLPRANQFAPQSPDLTCSVFVSEFLGSRQIGPRTVGPSCPPPKNGALAWTGPNCLGVIGKMGTGRLDPGKLGPSPICQQIGPALFGAQFAVFRKIGPRQIGPLVNWPPANWAPEKFGYGKLGPSNWGPGKSGPGKTNPGKSGLGKSGPSKLGPICR